MQTHESNVLLDVFDRIKYMDSTWMIKEIEDFIYTTEEQFDEKGNLVLRCRYRFDKLDGKYEEYDGELRLLKLLCYYRDSVLHGPYNSYYINENSFVKESNLRVSTNFKDWKLHGEYFAYGYEGQMTLATAFKDGKLDGDYYAFFDDGNQSCEKHYKEGELVGIHKEWNRKGKLFYQKYHD